jgi:hypothetical protein
MSEANNAVEVYKQTLETWRYEVNSYWQRSSYFSALETAAIAGCWFVAKDTPWLGLTFSILGFASSIIWLITSIAVHGYVKYWWSAVKVSEARLQLEIDKTDSPQDIPVAI